MHELINLLFPKGAYTQEQLLEKDRKIRVWLGDKAIILEADIHMIKGGRLDEDVAIKSVNKILGISEPTLEERFTELLCRGNYFNDLTIKDGAKELAKIAEEHFKHDRT